MGDATTVNQLARLPAQAGIDPAADEVIELLLRMSQGSERMHQPRATASGWDPARSVGCPLTCGQRSARVARHLTRNTLRDWGMDSLIEDAETIVGELVANAVTHALRAASPEPVRENPGLRLLNCTSEVICAVLDSSDAAPVLKSPESPEETGRGLKMVDALTDRWGWSPMPSHGKAVWAILFCAEPSASYSPGVLKGQSISVIPG